MRQLPVHRVHHFLLRISLIVFLALLYTVVIPLHHHEDMVEHADCILCQLSYMAATIVTVCVCFSAAGIVIFMVRRIRTLFIRRCTFGFSTRAPPQFSL
jgi:hypothetical protein